MPVYSPTFTVLNGCYWWMAKQTEIMLTELVIGLAKGRPSSAKSGADLKGQGAFPINTWLTLVTLAHA